MYNKYRIHTPTGLVGCFKMHFNSIITAIVFPSVNLDRFIINELNCILKLF